MGWDALELPFWEQWLLEIAGKKRVPGGEKLDPFGTSWRTLSTQAKPWMQAIHDGNPIDREKRAEQVIVDLRGSGLVESDGKNLTPVGAAVLDRWKELPEEWEYELPLAVAFLREAVIHDADGFRDMLAFWWDIRQTFDEEELFADGEILLALPYLNQTGMDFNPWVAIRESGAAEASVPWAALGDMPFDEPEAARGALQRIRERLDPSRRLTARITFCRAMSLMFEGHAGAASAYLDDLRLPRRSSR